MDIKRKVIVEHREITVVELTEDEVAQIIKKHVGMEDSDVEFDVSTQGFLRGVTVRRILQSSEEKIL